LKNNNSFKLCSKHKWNYSKFFNYCKTIIWNWKILNKITENITSYVFLLIIKKNDFSFRFFVAWFDFVTKIFSLKDIEDTWVQSFEDQYSLSYFSILENTKKEMHFTKFIRSLFECETYCKNSSLLAKPYSIAKSIPLKILFLAFEKKTMWILNFCPYSNAAVRQRKHYREIYMKTLSSLQVCLVNALKSSIILEVHWITLELMLLQNIMNEISKILS